VSRDKKLTPPSSGGGSSPGPGSARNNCPTTGSEILIVDEIGIPLASTTVTVQPSGQSPFSTTTDGTGKICLSSPPGTSVQIQVPNIHEAAPGDSTTTSSGRHFVTNGTGP
jgi:hypothetical protein